MDWVIESGRVNSGRRTRGDAGSEGELRPGLFLRVRGLWGVARSRGRGPVARHGTGRLAAGRPSGLASLSVPVGASTIPSGAKALRPGVNAWSGGLKPTGNRAQVTCPHHLLAGSWPAWDGETWDVGLRLRLGVRGLPGEWSIDDVPGRRDGAMANSKLSAGPQVEANAQGAMAQPSSSRRVLATGTGARCTQTGVSVW